MAYIVQCEIGNQVGFSRLKQPLQIIEVFILNLFFILFCYCVSSPLLFLIVFLSLDSVEKNHTAPNFGLVNEAKS